MTAGWHILSVEETRDSAKKAAEVLQTEVEKEAKYWEDVLTVVESGWSVCRLPQERQTLGVKFGFNEGACRRGFPRGYLFANGVETLTPV